jgi:hypothetical protein
MSQGGYLWIRNATGGDLEKGYCHSYQMNDWDRHFNTVIPSFVAQRIYIEWGKEGSYKHDDAAEVVFQFADADGNICYLEIRARWPKGEDRRLEYSIYPSTNADLLQPVYTMSRYGEDSDLQPWMDARGGVKQSHEQSLPYEIAWKHDGEMVIELLDLSQFYDRETASHIIQYEYDTFGPSRRLSTDNEGHVLSTLQTLQGWCRIGVFVRFPSATLCRICIQR